MYESKLIDELLIVTKIGLSPSAYSMIDASRFVNHITYDDLLKSIIDFNSYINFIIDEYQESGLENYYVRLKSTGSIDLESIILDWAYKINQEKKYH